jgi:hypothetical protein
MGDTSSETLVWPLHAQWLAQRFRAPTVLRCEGASQLAQQVHSTHKAAISTAPLKPAHSRMEPGKSRKDARPIHSTLDGFDHASVTAWIVPKLLQVDDQTLSITKQVQCACGIVGSDMIGLQGKVGIFESGSYTPPHLHQMEVVSILIKGRKRWRFAPPGKYTAIEFERIAVTIEQDAGSIIVIPPCCGACRSLARPLTHPLTHSPTLWPTHSPIIPTPHPSSLTLTHHPYASPIIPNAHPSSLTLTHRP